MVSGQGHAAMGFSVAGANERANAGTVGRLAIARASAALDPAGVRPLYVRRPDAEIARENKR